LWQISSPSPCKDVFFKEEEVDRSLNMEDANAHPEDSFLYPQSRYYGKFDPVRFLFDANLQEFAQKISYICALETGGKLSSIEAYKEIKKLWKDLKKSKKALGIGEDPNQPDPD
jgi:hypothetical protein